MIMLSSQIKIIGFDADDTLWVNEPYYQEVERQFCEILIPYLETAETSRELFKTEMQNLEIYGFGAKGFLLSMVETALRSTENRIQAEEIVRVIEIGKTLFTMPIQLLDGVEEVLKQLQGKYRLILATKGDLLDQERKLQKSGLIEYFHHIEIMSDKQDANYLKLLAHLDIEPNEFLMVPFEVTWQHEIHHAPIEEEAFKTISTISDLLKLV
jgi:putative hydrolase of the HAD superfamily